MQRRKFGPLPVQVPVIGMGTWQLELDQPERSVAALRAGLDIGMTHIDTAEMYGSGQAEALVGKAIEGRRAEVFLVSKVLPENASRKGTRQACERSLKQLRTDYLDLYLLHWPSSHPLSETIAAFEELRSAGKIRAYGVSNFDVPDMEEALKLAGEGNLACNQVLYHLNERRIEHRVLPWCERNGVALVAYTPFGRAGFPPPGERGRVLARIAEKHRATPRQIALAFVTRNPLCFTIPKTSNIDHIRENAGAAGVSLDRSDLEALEASFPIGKLGSTLPTL
ncbi:MAG TPA: aldo/keto reductase [Polyangiaceae bacterium]|nr:aldo/keto reductase [Polyangiaceae bacterium]